MPEDAAQDSSGGTVPVATYSLVERQQTEVPVEGRWPRAWRLWFLIGAGLLAWAATILLLRWL